MPHEGPDICVCILDHDRYTTRLRHQKRWLPPPRLSIPWKPAPITNLAVQGLKFVPSKQWKSKPHIVYVMYICVYIYIVMIVYVCMCSLQLWFFLVFWLCGHFVFKPFSDRSVKTLRCERLDPNLTNFAGRTALLVACGFDHTEVVMQLLRSERRGLATWGLHGASTFGHWCLWSMGVSIIGI